MARKLSLILLIITILSLAFSLTSCNTAGENFVDSLHGFLPERGSSTIADYAHSFLDWAAEKLESLFSFNWAKSIWEGLDNALGVTDKIEQSRTAIELIKTGNFKNIIEGLEILFGCGILLLILGLLVIIAVAVAIVIETCGEILFIAFLIIAIPVILISAIVGLVEVIIPKFF